jgi:outer membrane protein assembly factor BamB
MRRNRVFVERTGPFRNETIQHDSRPEAMSSGILRMFRRPVGGGQPSPRSPQPALSAPPLPAEAVEADQRISSDPAVQQGCVYFNTLFSHLYALDAKTGQQLWDVEKEGLVYSKPALAGDMLYFGAGDSCLYAFAAGSGRERWRFKAGGMVCYPSVYDGKVLFGGGEHLYVLE